MNKRNCGLNASSTYRGRRSGLLAVLEGTLKLHPSMGEGIFSPFGIKLEQPVVRVVRCVLRYIDCIANICAISI